ncbi:EF-hand calcium-binding domain-containing protein 14-like isoform X1 [Lycorma delicatula]|uniref:EF-hand calcium-binding domain-containing protein 14-like isoform X1 n=1 Tax=Lycorma delicatula TaxID=130591 RepID=UPI003F51254F
MTMDSTRVSVPLRVGGKKMRKRKELDALAGGKRCKRGGSASGEQQLLSDSSDEEVWTRSGRSRYLLRRRTCTSMLRACTALLILACVLATTTVMWLFIDVREQATFLRSQLDQVVAGNQGVPDALQKCHSVSRELQKNQTALSNKVTDVAQQLANYSQKVADVSAALVKLEKQLKGSPDLVNVASLSNSVAEFGSQISDLLLTTKQLKEYNKKLDDTTITLQQNITTLKEKISEVEVASSGVPTSAPENDALTGLTATVNSLRTNLTNINSTLSEKLQWALDDERKDSKAIQALQDMSANISARVTTLRDECNAKTKVITDLSSTVMHYNNQMDERVNELSNRVTDIQGMCSKLQNNAANNINNNPLNLESSSSDSAVPIKLKQPENTTDT